MLRAGLADLHAPGAILLLATYELGQQPLNTAVPAAAFYRAAYHPVQLDLSRQSLEAETLAAAQLVAFSTPMHTALVLARRMAKQIRAVRPELHLCAYGHYAWLHREELLADWANSVIGGEPTAPLLALAEHLAATPNMTNSGPATLDQPAIPGLACPQSPGNPNLSRPAAVLPRRTGLPPLSQYAQLETTSTRRLAGTVASSTGCKHLCRHCPIPPVYKGRFFATPVEMVLEDILRLIDAGAEHISFVDPDFLNGPTHAVRMVTALHDQYPSLTYDFTAKVGHLIANESRLRLFVETGCAFVVSAVESLSDRVLSILRKGHSRREVERVFALAQQAGLTIRPTFVPFTPWSGLDDYRALLSFVAREHLIGQVDAVQLSLRLLVPRGSLLADHPAFLPFRGIFDAEHLTYPWKHTDSRMDALQTRISHIAAQAATKAAAGNVRGSTAGQSEQETFAAIVAAAWAPDLAVDNMGTDGSEAPVRYRPQPAPPVAEVSVPKPRLTEPWFC